MLVSIKLRRAASSAESSLEEITFQARDLEIGNAVGSHAGDVVVVALIHGDVGKCIECRGTSGIARTRAGRGVVPDLDEGRLGAARIGFRARRGGDIFSVGDGEIDGRGCSKLRALNSFLITTKSSDRKIAARLENTTVDAGGDGVSSEGSAMISGASGRILIRPSTHHTKSLITSKDGRIKRSPF